MDSSVQPLKERMHQACRSGDVAEVVRCLDAGWDVNEVIVNDLVALHVAAIRNQGEVCTLLAQRGADVESKGRYTGTPLEFTTTGQLKAALALLQAGASLSPEGLVARQLLCEACKQGDEALCAALLDRGVPLMSSYGDSTPSFHEAMANHKPNVGHVFLSRGLDVNTQDTLGRTALYHAVANDAIESMAWLLDHGADPELASAKGQTPLMLAVSTPVSPNTAYLIGRGADFMRVGSDGKSAFDVLIDNDCPQEAMACLALASDFDAARQRLMERAQHGWRSEPSMAIFPQSPLEAALRTRCTELLMRLLDRSQAQRVDARRMIQDLNEALEAARSREHPLHDVPVEELQQMATLVRSWVARSQAHAALDEGNGLSIGPG